MKAVLRRLVCVLAYCCVAPCVAAPAADAPQRPPNVLVWMMDDVGFGQVSSYGGLVDTPNIDRIAAGGLRFTNYHTAPICSAARAAFLTGRMPHSVHIGGHATAARDFPGYDAKIPASAGTVAENLRQGGYATFAVGKWDHLPNEQASPAGPFTYWPSGQGFEKFYGFLAADTDNWNPTLVRDHTPIDLPQGEGYHLSSDMADQAIAMIGTRRAADPARPFFMYWATGAAHAPHHAPQDWLDRYRGRFDEGWDRARERILANQIRLGLLQPGATPAKKPDEMPAWEELGPDARRLYARQMEAFAASLSWADAQFGRVLDALERSGELANTLIVIVSDNGASAEGGPNGLYNEAEVTSRAPPGVAGNLRFLDRWGGPETYPHYAYGWAVAGNTPFRYFKQTTHEGGTRVPLVMAWPDGIAARGELRQQFVHVSDIAPTLLQATGVTLAATVNDTPQQPMEGSSVASAFGEPGDPRAGRAQYVELYGNRGLWEQGWSIVTSHRYRTWEWNTAKTFDEPWELYDVVSDPGQTQDLATREPERVARMDREFWRQAKAYNVAPIHNLSDTAAESYQRSARDFARRKGVWSYPGVVTNVPNAIAPPVMNLGFRFSTSIDLPAADTTGAVFVFGGRMGGIGLNLVDGRPVLSMNTLAGESGSVESPKPIGTGRHDLVLVVDKGQSDASGAADHAIRIDVDGRTIASQSLRFALPRFPGIGETFGVGIDSGSTVNGAVAPNRPIAATIRNAVFDFSGAGKLGPTIH